MGWRAYPKRNALSKPPSIPPWIIKGEGYGMVSLEGSVRGYYESDARRFGVRVGLVHWKGQQWS